MTTEKMDVIQVLQQLEAEGSEQNRKVYRRHGVGDNFYGVSFATLDKLRNQIKTDHDLARHLWDSGNHDARMLATRIADPRQMDDITIQAWNKDLQNYILTDSYADLLAKTSKAQHLAEACTSSDDEWVGRAGWRILAWQAIEENDLSDTYFEPYLEQIASDIHKRKNRVREAMNNALIAIGTRNSYLEKKAIMVAVKVGKVDVDHGDTNCKTPDPIPYIRKARARKARNQSKRN